MNMTAGRRHIRLGDRFIGEDSPVFFIAEAGVNHNGNVDLGRRLIEVAAEAGADAVKFQTFAADRIATRSAPKAQYHIETTGAEQSWYDLLKSQEMDRAMHEALMLHCERCGILFMSTPYDEQSADLLEELGVAGFKIASTDANNVPLLRHVAKKGRPIILSTAMCDLAEIRESVDAIRHEGLTDLVVLQCTGNYPAPLGESHMRALPLLRNELGVLVGYSDHTLESVNPVLAVAMGAVIYEKHFTVDRDLPGPDHRMSLPPEELARTVDLVRKAELALGSAAKNVQPSERDNRRLLRKSLVAARNLFRGEVLTSDAIAIKRPGTGLPPKHLDEVVGRTLVRDVPKDTVLDISLLAG